VYLLPRLRKPFPSNRVRLTSSYSKEDGVVRWEGCIVAEADCVEVTARIERLGAALASAGAGSGA
jgi:hypothetical protein